MIEDLVLVAIACLAALVMLGIPLVALFSG
jgi:hypothetical protein